MPPTQPHAPYTGGAARKGKNRGCNAHGLTALGLLLLSGCAPLHSPPSTATTFPIIDTRSRIVWIGTGGSDLMGQCTGTQPVAIAVASATDSLASAGTIHSGLGGLSHELTTALKTTGCFAVYERNDLKAISAEHKLAGRPLQLPGVDLLVSFAVTALQEDANHGTIGTGGGLIPHFRAPGGVRWKTAYIAADIRIFEVRTARIIATQKVEGTASGVVVGWGPNSWGVNQPLGKAARQMIDQAVSLVTAQASRYVPVHSRE